jgi:hypothetical protein
MPHSPNFGATRCAWLRPHNRCLTPQTLEGFAAYHEKMLAAARHFEGVNCVIEVRRPGAGIVVVLLSGTDTGELGEAPFRELQGDLDRYGTITLFIDARLGRAASVDVSGRWASWLRANRGRLRGVHMLCSTRFIELSADMVRRFAELGDTMRLYRDERAFEAELARVSQVA